MPRQAGSDQNQYSRTENPQAPGLQHMQGQFYQIVSQDHTSKEQGRDGIELLPQVHTRENQC